MIFMCVYMCIYIYTFLSGYTFNKIVFTPVDIHSGFQHVSLLSLGGSFKYLLFFTPILERFPSLTRIFQICMAQPPPSS